MKSECFGTRFLRRSNQRKSDSNSGERECAKRAKVMTIGKDKIKTCRILFAKVFSLCLTQVQILKNKTLVKPLLTRVWRKRQDAFL